jgi:hypothetical protein
MTEGAKEVECPISKPSFKRVNRVASINKYAAGQPADPHQFGRLSSTVYSGYMGNSFFPTKKANTFVHLSELTYPAPLM